LTQEIESNRIFHICRVKIHYVFNAVTRYEIEKFRGEITVWISLCSAEAERIGRSFHQSPFPWPPKPPERDRGVFFAGYSSVAQESPDSRITWGTATGLMVADTVEWDRIMMPLDRAYWVPHPTLRLPSEDEDWGGVSGGPLFSLVHGDSIVGWRFSGIVVEYLPIRGAQILRAAPITPVRPDGTIQVPI
jgi:hypothetical protein